MIPRTKELERVKAIPWRAFDSIPRAELVAKWSEALRKVPGVTLFELQAIALEEASVRKRGIVAPIPVGGGKTLLSLLLPHVYELQGAPWVLLQPASLVDKTLQEMHVLSKQWRVNLAPRVISYERLGRVNAAHELDVIKPRLIVADEAHKLKNYKAAVTRRVARYMQAHPDTIFCALSGTLLQASLRDLAHLCAWALGNQSPMPLNEEIANWADSLGEQADKAPEDFRDVSAIADVWASDVPGDEIARARIGFQRRFRATPGVIAPPLEMSTEEAACSIQVATHASSPVEDPTQAHFALLRERAETPDGWALSQAVESWNVAQQLALGFHYVWDPRPPEEWYAARKDWAQFVRETLRNSRELDSELAVAREVERQRFGPAPMKSLTEWRRLRGAHSYELRPAWHDSDALDLALAWLEKHRGIAWCQHRFFAEELAKRAKVPCFGQGGIDARTNASILQHRGGPIVATLACATGFNLQDRWHSNLIVCPSPSAKVWEQLVGRTHRSGQKADSVIVGVLVRCIENHNSVERAKLRARMVRDLTGHQQKLLLADFSEHGPKLGKGPAWTPPKAKDFDYNALLDLVSE